jgi:wobble nucleotide-excising tRNase
MAKKIGIAVLVLLSLLGTALVSYESGLKRNSELEAIKLMVIVQRQSQCIERMDAQCTKDANKMLAQVVRGQLNRAELANLPDSDRKLVENFLRLAGEGK